MQTLSKIDWGTDFIFFKWNDEENKVFVSWKLEVEFMYENYSDFDQFNVMISRLYLHRTHFIAYFLICRVDVSYVINFYKSIQKVCFLTI